ncbi:MAG: YceI family protein [Akkermansiaceae bacterium]
MMNTVFMSAVTTMFLATTAMAKPVAVILDESNKVTWQAVGTPGFLKINGEGGQVQGGGDLTAGKISGKFTVELKNYVTGIKLRDEHLKFKYLDVEKYPLATMTIKDVATTGSGWVDFKGLLKVKTDEKPIAGKMKLKGDHVEAKFTMSLKDYPAIGSPSYLGISMADTVDVTLSFRYL